MSVYHGWNREKMERVGAAVKLNEDQKYSDTLVPGLKPANTNRAHVETTYATRTPHSVALDSDALYDLPLDRLPQSPTTKGKKRGPISKQQGLAVTTGGVWECTDGDMTGQNQGVDPEEERSLKRRKAVSAKPSKSTRPPSKILKSIWKKDAMAKPDDQGNSQLTTPPKTDKKTKRTTNSSKTQLKDTKMGPFKNPLITKASSTSMEGNPNLMPKLLQPASHHQPWVTTQEALNSSSRGITKTTLDKLTAFRHTASFADSSAFPLAVSRHKDQDLQHDAFIQQSETIHRTQQENSSCTIVPSNNSIFDDGYIDHHLPPQPDHVLEYEALLPHPPRTQPGFSLHNVGSDLVGQTSWYEEQANDLVEDYPFHQDENWTSRQSYAKLSSDDLLQAEQFGPPLPLAPSFVTAPMNIHKNILSHGEPLAILHHTDNDLPKTTMGAEEDHSLFENYSPRTAIEDEDPQKSYRRRGGIGKLIVSEEDIHKLPGLSKTLTTANNFLPRHSKGRFNIEKECSEIDDYDKVPIDISKSSELNDFDEGLDDADFFQLASNAAVAATQNISKRSNRGLSEPVDQITPSINKLLVNGDHVEKRVTSPTTLCPANDNEYSVDEEDEADMLRLLDLTVVEMEGFQASDSPTLVTYPNASNTVYNTNQQYVPIESQPTPRHQSVQEHAGVHEKPENSAFAQHDSMNSIMIDEQAEEDEDWSFIRINQARESDASVPPGSQKPPTTTSALTGDMVHASFSEPHEKLDKALELIVSRPATRLSPCPTRQVLDDRHEYEPLKPFARPDFPPLTFDRSPVPGLSTQTFLRTCFRIGEMLKEGGRNDAQHQGAIIELFARVTFSSREAGNTKQHFQFADLWHDRPPFTNGVLFNYKTTDLADSESEVFVKAGTDMISRCIGRLKRDPKQENGWLLHIINIRPTDWEEIRWTRRIVSASYMESKKPMSKL